MRRRCGQALGSLPGCRPPRDAVRSSQRGQRHSRPIEYAPSPPQERTRARPPHHLRPSPRWARRRRPTGRTLSARRPARLLLRSFRTPSARTPAHTLKSALHPENRRQSHPTRPHRCPASLRQTIRDFPLCQNPPTPSELHTTQERRLPALPLLPTRPGHPGWSSREPRRLRPRDPGYGCRHRTHRPPLPGPNPPSPRAFPRVRTHRSAIHPRPKQTPTVQDRCPMRSCSHAGQRNTPLYRSECQPPGGGSTSSLLNFVPS